MAQTLSLNLVDIIFSTKDRLSTIRDEIAPDLHAYLAGIARELDCEYFRAGGVTDHVHLAIRIATTREAADLVSNLKTSSTVWMKNQGINHFAWQRGYGLLSVGPTDLDALIRHIDAQRTNHAKHSFQDEMRAFLAKYHVTFDEQYIWG